MMVEEKIKVLFVDDEEQNLISFRANFRKAYEIHTALNAKDALDFLEKNPVHIIISDQRMPNITGVDFLEQTVKLYPDSIRLLITGQSDIDVVVDAINRGQITKFITKPWDWEKLSLAIDNCASLYQYRTEIKNKNAELQKINEELNKFVYSVSHDLRSPLTSILGLTNLAKEMPEMVVAQPYFEMIEGRVIKLDGFIKKIIAYYKNGRPEELIKDIDFKNLIESVWDPLKDQDLSIKFELNVNQNGTFSGDLFRLEIILDNLISNAIKYQNPLNDNRNIHVTVDSDDKIAKIIISDNGVGIDQSQIDNVFKLFYRAENSLNASGSGIGLYIVKEAVEKMNGKISVNSEQLVKTSIEIEIPNKKEK
ncbi:MAG: hybrid sensor histidine kinase/response regulator [Bacteroidota bacterium]